MFINNICNIKIIKLQYKYISMHSAVDMDNTELELSQDTAVWASAT